MIDLRGRLVALSTAQRTRVLLVIQLSTDRPYALIIHGGAGATRGERDLAAEEATRESLRRAFFAGEQVLVAGGDALDAVCAAVCVLEDDPRFNAGRGAELTAQGTAEHDAAVMRGDGSGGAVAVSRFARHPVLLARAVMENTPHVLLVDPPREVVEGWGIETAEADWFITDRRRQQLARILAEQEQASGHGTVGAVALDQSGRLAAATSTGGIANQSVGRVGDTPILGAGTYARDGVVAVSCTGRGEAFMQGVVAHDVAARMAYGGASLAEAAAASIAFEITARGVLGALIAVGADGQVVLHGNAPGFLAAWRDGDDVRTQIRVN